MKKISAFFLALALCFGLAVPAFAADGGAYLSSKAPKNSGTIFLSQRMAIKLVGFARSGSNNTHITYGTFQDCGDSGYVKLAPKGVDIVVSGVKSADEIRLCAFTAANLEDGPFEEGQFKDLPGGAYLFARLFVQESGKDISILPLNTDDPMEFEYDDPKDGKTLVAGNITPTDAGFQANGDGDVVLNSERLYELLDEGDLLQVIVGNSFWLYRLSGDPLLVSDVFTDVDTGTWVSDPVAWALMSDITNGTAEDKFSPAQNCTQAQILTFLYRAAREEQVESSSEDMELAVQWAREKGIIDDSFDGNTPCTRATAVSYIWQAFDKPNAQASSFTDVPTDASYGYAVDWAVEKGVTNGTSDTDFSPDKVCNRGEIVTFLYRAYN